jgi:membrane protein insertase Oxa1/YidC/SpoIIIJ
LLFQAVTFYWFTTNLVSIVVAKVIRTKALRKKLNIPELIRWNKDNLPVGAAPKKGFRESIREGEHQVQVGGGTGAF